jgi:hypothetical protein
MVDLGDDHEVKPELMSENLGDDNVVAPLDRLCENSLRVVSCGISPHSIREIACHDIIVV